VSINTLKQIIFVCNNHKYYVCIPKIPSSAIIDMAERRSDVSYMNTCERHLERRSSWITTHMDVNSLQNRNVFLE